MDRMTSMTTFVKVVDVGGFAAAARKLNISPSMVTMHVRALEERLGILLVEAADRVLTTFSPKLSAKAARSLEKLGVTVLTNRTVNGVDAEGVTIDDGTGMPARIPCRTVIWAAGATASNLASKLGELTGAERDGSGRVAVEPDLTLPGHPEVFALGDMVRVRAADGVPRRPTGGCARRDAAGPLRREVVRARLRSEETPPFHYRDKGNIATVGRAAAVAEIKGLRLSGFVAWVTWLVIHLWYLVGFQNRLVVLIRWSFSFVVRSRGARLITQPAAEIELDD